MYGSELAGIECGPIEDHAVVAELAHRLADVAKRTVCAWIALVSSMRPLRTS
jgi:hypothetical protein